MFPEYQTLAGKGIERTPVHTAQESLSITVIHFPVIPYKTDLAVVANYLHVLQHGLWLSHYLEIFFFKGYFLKEILFSCLSSSSYALKIHRSPWVTVI